MKRSGEDVENPKSPKAQKPLVEWGVFTQQTICQQAMNKHLYNLRCELVIRFNVDNGNSVISRLLMLNVIQMRTILHSFMTGKDTWHTHAMFEQMHRLLDEIFMTTVVIDDYAAIDSIEENAQYHEKLGIILRETQSYCLKKHCHTPDEAVKLFENEDADYRTMIKEDDSLRSILFKTLKMISPDGIIKFKCFDGNSLTERSTSTA